MPATTSYQKSKDRAISHALVGHFEYCRFGDLSRLLGDALYNGRYYLSMLRYKLKHVSKMADEHALHLRCVLLIYVSSIKKLGEFQTR